MRTLWRRHNTQSRNIASPATQKPFFLFLSLSFFFFFGSCVNDMGQLVNKVDVRSNALLDVSLFVGLVKVAQSFPGKRKWNFYYRLTESVFSIFIVEFDWKTGLFRRQAKSIGGSVRNYARDATQIYNKQVRNNWRDLPYVPLLSVNPSAAGKSRIIPNSMTRVTLMALDTAFRNS
jgi:hypothetical protein